MEQTQEYLSLSQAARAVPAIDGKRPHNSTIFRWMTDGVRGVKLEHRRIGRRMVTTREALDRFFEATAEAPAQRAKHLVAARSDKQRDRDVAAAKASLAARKAKGGAA